MIKPIKNFYRKLFKTVYHKGYIIEFNKDRRYKFKEFIPEINSIGTWIVKNDNLWICTSSITNKNVFLEQFIKLTKIKKEYFKIEEKYYPFILKY